MDIKEITLRFDEPLELLAQRHIATNGVKEFADSYAEMPELQRNPNFRDSSELAGHTSGVLVLQNERQDGDMLYLGSCHGFGISIFENLGYRVAGIDIDKYATQQSKKRGLDVLAGDAMRLPFADGSFDVTISRDLLREDYLRVLGRSMDLTQDISRQALTEQHRVLREGGIVVIYSKLWDVFREQTDSEAYKTITIARDQLLPIERYRDLPFREVRRYNVLFAGIERPGEQTIRQYVDVFQK